MARARWILVGKFLLAVGIALCLFSTVAALFQRDLAFAGDHSGRFPFEASFANALSLNADLDKSKFTYIMLALFPFTLFEVLFGTYFSRDFAVTGIYLFTRRYSRTRWVFKKCATLLLFSALFVGLLFASGGLTLLARGAQVENLAETAAAVAQIFGAQTAFYFALTLAVNVLSVLFGSAPAFVAVNAPLVGMVLTELSYDPEHLGTAFKLNFISNLIPAWHSFSQPSWAAATRVRITAFSHLFTLIYFGAIALLVFAFGLVMIRRMDISVQERETT